MPTSKGAVLPHRRGRSGPLGGPDALGTIRWMLEQFPLTASSLTPIVVPWLPPSAAPTSTPITTAIPRRAVDGVVRATEAARAQTPAKSRRPVEFHGPFLFFRS